MVNVDDTLQVGDVIAIVTTEGLTKEYIEKPKHEEKEENESKQSFFSPAVLKYAKENKLSLEELQKIEGTGDGKRVTKKDIESFIKSKVQKIFRIIFP